MGTLPAAAHQPCGGEVNEEPHDAIFRAWLEPAGAAGAVNPQFSLRRLADGWA